MQSRAGKEDLYHRDPEYIWLRTAGKLDALLSEDSEVKNSRSHDNQHDFTSRRLCFHVGQGLGRLLQGERLVHVDPHRAPIDQFSFKEDSSGHLNVLVRAEQNGGDWMWGPEASAGDVALMRVPVAAFSSRVGTVRSTAYRELPAPGKGYTMQNRFVGAYVLYGTGSSWGYAEEERDDRVYVYPYSGGSPNVLELAHGVDRIEAMGDGAVVIGTDGRDLHFSSIDLERQAVSDRYRQKGASQGELRSHGFFYKPMADGKGVLGLPIRAAGGPGYEHLIHGSAQVLFLDVDRLRFSKLGALEAGRETPDDQCVVSCVDWYGNARPIFYRGRIFALMGYELVEGSIASGRIREIGRTSFLKRRVQAAR